MYIHTNVCIHTDSHIPKYTQTYTGLYLGGGGEHWPPLIDILQSAKITVLTPTVYRVTISLRMHVK